MNKLSFIKIFLLISLFVFIGCKSPENSSIIQTQNSSVMFNSFEKEYSKFQFDSICVADTIINDLSKWHVLTTIDDASNETFSEYFYIKSLGNNECIYRLYKTKNGYKISKRIRKTVK